MMAALTAWGVSIAEFCGWRKQVAINKPIENQRNDIKDIRNETKNELDYNAGAVKYGVDSDGRVRWPSKDK